jgi:putative methanogenesis marker protein 8
MASSERDGQESGCSSGAAACCPANPEPLIQKYRHLADFHLTRVMGAWVAISQGKVIEVERSCAMQFCPLQAMLSGADIETYAQEKVSQLKQFTPEREVWRADFGVPFGASEMFMVALRKGFLDCTVTVCDGAGTVATNVPEVVQGIGARMNGVFYTSPIRQVQEKLRAHHCLLLDDGRIDQVEGVRRAIAAGFRRIAVTVNARLGARLEEFRDLEKTAGVSLTVAAVCTTGIGAGRANEVVTTSDLAWACASHQVREQALRARVQVTQGIPIYVYTARGLDILVAYSDEEGGRLLRGLDPHKQYLLAAGGSEGASVVLGTMRLRLREARLPVRAANEPVPLT